MTPQWLERLILSSALDLEAASKAVFQFSNKIRKNLQDNPVQPWEAAAWARGLNRGLLKLEGYFFRAGAGKNSGLSFFVRNEQGIQVGLRREAITQAAMYVQLITDHGYSRDQTRFESQWMDVAVYDESGRASLYVETKAGHKVLEKLCRRLESEFSEQVPFSPGDDEKPPKDDALRKAQHIWRHKPPWFWGVSPTQQAFYDVRYQSQGFRLQAREKPEREDLSAR